MSGRAGGGDGPALVEKGRFLSGLGSSAIRPAVARLAALSGKLQNNRIPRLEKKF